MSSDPNPASSRIPRNNLNYLVADRSQRLSYLGLVFASSKYGVGPTCQGWVGAGHLHHANFFLVCKVPARTELSHVSLKGRKLLGVSAVPKPSWRTSSFIFALLVKALPRVKRAGPGSRCIHRCCYTHLSCILRFHIAPVCFPCPLFHEGSTYLEFPSASAHEPHPVSIIAVAGRVHPHRRDGCDHDEPRGAPV